MGRRMPMTEEESYGDVSYRDHPLYGIEEGYEEHPSTPTPQDAIIDALAQAMRNRQAAPSPTPPNLSTPPNPMEGQRMNPELLQRLMQVHNLKQGA